MDSKYIYDEKSNMLIVTCDTKKVYEQNAVKSFCNDHHINLKEFNIPVLIQENVKYCVGLFRGCESFNQPIVIPQNVVWCNSMFYGCTAFNQKIDIPNSVEICWRMFGDCKVFNQTVMIPDSVINTKEMFQGCIVLNKKIKLSNNILDGSGMFADCEVFNWPVELPLTMENCGGMFRGCQKFNQPVIIPESVTFTAEMFKNCEILNQPIELCVTSSLYCNDMFVNTPLLHKDNITIYCTKAGQKNLGKILKKMWGTETSVDEVNVCIKGKSKSSSKIMKISCFLTENEQWEIAENELVDCPMDKVLKKVEEFLGLQKAILLEIEEKSKNSMNCLSVNCDRNIYSIGIVDEWNDVVYYYNSGKNEEDVEIRGNMYPSYMVSDDKEVVFNIVKDFLKTGKPSRKVKWIKE